MILLVAKSESVPSFWASGPTGQKGRQSAGCPIVRLNDEPKRSKTSPAKDPRRRQRRSWNQGPIFPPLRLGQDKAKKRLQSTAHRAGRLRTSSSVIAGIDPQRPARKAAEKAKGLSELCFQMLHSPVEPLCAANGAWIHAKHGELHPDTLETTFCSHHPGAIPPSLAKHGTGWHGGRSATRRVFDSSCARDRINVPDEVVMDSRRFYPAKTLIPLPPVQRAWSDRLCATAARSTCLEC